MAIDYAASSLGRVFTVHMERGEDVLGTLERVVQETGMLKGVILTGYGTVDLFCYHRVTTADIVPTDEYLTVEAPLEILSISGWIMGGAIHSHITVADGERAFGGHLEKGTRVLYRCNVVLAELA